MTPASQKNRASEYKTSRSPRAAVAFSTLDLLHQIRSAMQRWLSSLRGPQTVKAPARQPNRYASSEIIFDEERPWLTVYLPRNTQL